MKPDFFFACASLLYVAMSPGGLRRGLSLDRRVGHGGRPAVGQDGGRLAEGLYGLLSRPVGGFPVPLRGDPEASRGRGRGAGRRERRLDHGLHPSRPGRGRCREGSDPAMRRSEREKRLGPVGASKKSAGSSSRGGSISPGTSPPTRPAKRPRSSPCSPGSIPPMRPRRRSSIGCCGPRRRWPGTMSSAPSPSDSRSPPSISREWLLTRSPSTTMPWLKDVLARAYWKKGRSGRGSGGIPEAHDDRPVEPGPLDDLPALPLPAGPRPRRERGQGRRGRRIQEIPRILEGRRPDPPGARPTPAGGWPG